MSRDFLNFILYLGILSATLTLGVLARTLPELARAREAYNGIDDPLVFKERRASFMLGALLLECAPSGVRQTRPFPTRRVLSTESNQLLIRA